ncbi:N-acetylglucosamine-6-phosphate deacetylase [Blochmannia endosymbiont of Polyrhachis (Hedomyrma) turneri]|uniref:N-acetylglucosamine-6-phosphate deacetylase n=1 Tax=Blochmannia endosymbiont of Polyrhachis (Hedomyrma) turneri TaxID=1505596 RepID=UPI00061A7797|nr:N-acetylglucosamine-6-phosphate deacetylase [Blochmannia endosymbiont of Polyrhachis (Hedomyrma) turneri]AKC59889.1 N-acetylglucosamine-6-phosphate deacetylase [Blochmannia endosymbiont of Polyrhachis (Hedomyrma) turneri]
MYALTNAQIYTSNEILDQHIIIIDQEIIKGIYPKHKLPKMIKQYNLCGAILSPGFIDLQVNGCGGVQFNNGENALSTQTLEIMQKTNHRFGCTSFLPTLITTTNSCMIKAIDTVRFFLKNNRNQILGLHLEGPYLNPQKSGTHNVNLIRQPTKPMVNYLCENHDVIVKITLAPEKVKDSIIRKFNKSGICVSIGHSNATYQESKQSFNAGVSCATHLFNAMSLLNAREPGVVGAIFDTPEIYCSIIADGLHVNWANIRIAKYIKGDHLILSTDSTAPAGANNIKEFLFSNKKINCLHGVCLDQNGIFSGSSLTMIDAIRNTVKFVGLTLYETLRMATLYPARAIGVDNKLGSLSMNKIANLTAFTQEYKIIMTIVNGKHVIF